MPIMQSAPGPETIVDGRRYLYFGGTAYLGLQSRSEVIRAAAQAVERYGVGSATTRAWFGDTPPVVDVERLAALWFDSEAAFYFASGFMSNHVLTGFLADEFEAAFADDCAHYSLMESLKIAGRPIMPFAHRDPEALAASIRARLRPGQRPLVATDGVFPVLGDTAPLDEYARLLADYPGAILLVDDAHGVGVVGGNGRGVLEHLQLLTAGGNGLSPSGPVRLFFSGTLSKALGGFGGLVPGTREFIARLKHRSPYFAGASGPAVPVAAASAKAIELALAEPELRTRLRENAEQIRSGLRRIGLTVGDSPSAIIGLKVGSGDDMARIQRELAGRGILIAHAVNYAGAGPGGALRIAAFATHTAEMIDRLVENVRVILG